MAPTILVLEDNQMMQTFLRNYLGQRFKVKVMENPKKALKALRMGDWPDLILLDLNLPEMHGWQFIDKLRDEADLKQIPVMILSGNNKSKDRITSFEKGVADYLTKPFNPQELMLRVKNVITTYRRSTEFVSFN